MSVLLFSYTLILKVSILKQGLPCYSAQQPFYPIYFTAGRPVQAGRISGFHYNFRFSKVSACSIISSMISLQLWRLLTIPAIWPARTEP